MLSFALKLYIYIVDTRYIEDVYKYENERDRNGTNLTPKHKSKYKENRESSKNQTRKNNK